MSYPRTIIRPHTRTPADTPAPGTPALVAGQLVLERYRLLECLGSGGFGVVWRARDESLDREVALKRVLRAAWGAAGQGSGDTREDRAKREALASARLSHPAIAALYEARDDGDALYLISELVRGDPLRMLIADGSLDDRRTVAIGIAMCEALLHAHAHGVIHRDVTPANVIVLRDTAAPGEAPAKLTDFGSALLAPQAGNAMGAGLASDTGGEVLGTLTYMAPEQRRGRHAGAQTDLFSLAVVLYEALSAVNPLRGPTGARWDSQHVPQAPPLGQERPDLPAQLSRAIDRALQPDPAHRGTVGALRDALVGERAAVTRAQPAQTIRA
ncbi:MAG: serine/threonine-protein kinase, partial [Solirubrobacteraceae bacterium]